MHNLDDALSWGISPEGRDQCRKPPVKMSSAAPKVVEEIPIQFFEPELSPFPTWPRPRSQSPSRSQSQHHHRTASALKIQKVFRGFLVRRSMKKLIAITRDVDEIERRILDGEMLDWILIDKKEGLRVIETLMNLLFKLDSVRGVNSDVRDCRKSVANRTIYLQEIVDAAVSAVDRTETQTSGEREDDSQRNSESTAQTLESIPTDEQYSVSEIDESDGFKFDHGSRCSSEYDDEGAGIGDDDENYEDKEVGDFVMVGDGDKEVEDDDVVDKSLQESLDTSRVEETLTEGGAVKEKDATINPVEETSAEGTEQKEVNKKNKKNELLLKIMEENQKIISQLCENHKTQMNLLNLLDRRVQRLEMSHGYLCRLLNKKNKNKRSN